MERSFHWSPRQRRGSSNFLSSYHKRTAFAIRADTVVFCKRFLFKCLRAAKAERQSNAPDASHAILHWTVNVYLYRYKRIQTRVSEECWIAHIKWEYQRHAKMSMNFAHLLCTIVAVRKRLHLENAKKLEKSACFLSRKVANCANYSGYSQKNYEFRRCRIAWQRGADGYNKKHECNRLQRHRKTKGAQNNVFL